MVKLLKIIAKFTEAKMEKLTKKIIYALSFLLIVSLILNCGGGSGSGGGKSDFVGEWEYSRNNILVIKSDNTYNTVSRKNNEVKDEGKWRVKDNELQFKSGKNNRTRVFKILAVNKNSLRLRRFFHTSGRKAKGVKTLKRLK